MKQVIQNNTTGEIILQETPVPGVKPGTVLVRTAASAVSAGTERQMMEFAQKSLLGKALARPDLVRKVVAAAQTEGVLEAYRAATTRLDTPTPMGYSSAGIVSSVGAGAMGYKVGDRLACSGSGFACHAEYVTVAQTLCAPIPEGVSDEHAAFAALGAIALHALRLAELQLGDRVAIIGLGLLGLLAVQIARAWGCQVLGADVAANRADLARQLGADEAIAGGKEAVLAAAQTLFGSQRADAVIIFASASSNEPLELAAELARVRGRIVVPGLVGLDVPRRAFYEKELDLKVSRAWGPGLYDPAYEERGHDYPLPFVRWTAGRNMEAFLHLVAQGSVRVQPLITHRFPLERAAEAYQLISEGREPYIGVVLTYPTADVAAGHRPQPALTQSPEQRQGAAEGIAAAVGLKPQTVDSTLPSAIRVGFIGAGNFAKATLLPAIHRLKGVHLRGIASATGVSARHAGDKFGFDYCTTDYHELLGDPHIDAIIIATRHDSHASLTAAALRAGKHVFVEKPLALNKSELDELVQTYQEVMAGGVQPTAGDTAVRGRRSPVIMVGFNRRFSPFTVALKQWLAFSGLPMVVQCRVNAGYVPPERWEQNPETGGGRIVGEVCHFIDLIQYLADASPVQVYAQAMQAAGQYTGEDNLVIALQMGDGSVGTITYTASGDKAFPRERIEVFRGGAVGLIENFSMASFTRQGHTRRKRNLLAVDRGHRAEMAAFFSAICVGGPPPVSFAEYVLTTLATFAIVESMQRGEPVCVEHPTALAASLRLGSGGQE